jgi:ribose-phosphate pyrophosphokinase
MPDQSKLITVPAGKLGIVALQSSAKLGQKVNEYLVKWRKEREHLDSEHLMFNGYTRDTYLLESCCPRFASGEAKGTLSDSVRGSDLYILADVTNTGIE